MMKYLCAFASGFLALSLFTGCGKDSEPKKLTFRQGNYMLSRQPWQLTGKSINGNDALAECARDDTLFFVMPAGNDEDGNPNPGGFLLKSGGVPCENTIEDSDTLNNGTWELTLQNNRTGLGIVLSGQKDTITAIIDRITGQYLTLSYPVGEDQVREEYISVSGE